MEQKRIKVRLTKNSPYSEYGYYEKGDIGYIDGYVNDNAVIILENGKFAKAGLRWIEVVNDKDKNVNTELAESEDEKIKKEIITYIKWCEDGGYCAKEEMIRWITFLEKQGEKKPTEKYNITGIGSKNAQGKLGEMIKNLKPVNEVLEQKPWSEEDENKVTLFMQLTEGCDNEEELADWLKSLKGRVQPQQRQEWSEEDNIILSRIIADYERSNEEWFNAQNSLPHGRKITWLKSLRPQNTWKPSDEHMDALEAVINNRSFQRRHLDSLYADLKKLKGEE